MRKNSPSYYWGAKSSLVRKKKLPAEVLAKEVLKSPSRFEEMSDGLVSTVMSRVEDPRLRKKFARMICLRAIKEVESKKEKVGKRRLQVLRRMFDECSLEFGSTPQAFDALVVSEIPYVRGIKKGRKSSVLRFGSVALECWK